jgi:NAD(P)-dependent dehydrogenase (short-subunit alcohol dehydrogenase family)
MSKKLDGKIALVTGGNSGIGLGTAKRFAMEGAKVIITGRRQAALDAAIKEIGNDAISVPADAANLADLDRLFSEIKQRYGHLDILFANAGGGEFGTIEQVTEEQFDKTYNTNVNGTFFTVQKALPLLRAGSAIVVNGSITSIKGSAAFGVYSSTKAAVRSLVRTWANELGPRKIRVNVVSPGPIETPGLSGLFKTVQEAQQYNNEMAKQIPVGRVGQPDDIAKVVVFLASEDASFVNGVELFADGGLVQI